MYWAAHFVLDKETLTYLYNLIGIKQKINTAICLLPRINTCFLEKSFFVCSNVFQHLPLSVIR
jgi:hypothetical protein